MGEFLNGSDLCNHNLTSFNQMMDRMYTYFYLLLFIPGLLLNTTALWVLCRHISKRTKAVIFMINLALADLVHILSLPLRIYYYFTHTWPFGRIICLFCFYLKYFNMYAAIIFLVCISMQRCAFLLNPFRARRWRRRYDLVIAVTVWVVVGVACSPFILMRIDSSSSTLHASTPLVITSTQQSTPFPAQHHSTATVSTTSGCFKDLPIRKVSLSVGITMITICELFGFLIPLALIGYSSFRTVMSLRHKETPDQKSSTALTRNRLQSVTSNGHSEKYHEQARAEKRRALRMVLGCYALFLFCFAPYHINFLLYLMVSQNLLTHCATGLAVRQFHPISLCIASLSCCLNPLLYYFLTAEFRMHLAKRTSSFNSSVLSSPVTSPSDCPAQCRLLRLESTCSK
ncbi:putative P2Y purinoceptor 10 [Oryzias melastigma]|uniref:P2Y receptor family member 10 n=1 Tax=Oryzias melastigma TaxID=30732 RepID=A0A3B3DKZ4_ORYME|nr:putative P2Y purinoceptor 10 [Oryzias melastigma]